MDKREREVGQDFGPPRELGGCVRPEQGNAARRDSADSRAPAGPTRHTHPRDTQKNGARRRRLSRGKTVRSERSPDFSVRRRGVDSRKRGVYRERPHARSPAAGSGLDQQPVDGAAGNEIEIGERQFSEFLGRYFLEFFGGRDGGDYVVRHGKYPFPLSDLVGLAGPELFRHGANCEGPESRGESPVNALFTRKPLGHTQPASACVPRTSVAT